MKKGKPKLTKWQMRKRNMQFRINDLFSPLCKKIHFALYYDRQDNPDQIRGKFLDGVSEFCWAYACGDTIKHSLKLANIHWGIKNT
jgi:hypothetical protein